ncbi:carbohydrate ABC transporter permease [Pseudochelatococcus contaminans]|uniref:Multiple sugar transport system permease protein n=1 Tax=Pseudochelatococcus contaminans TaxID=1538103 RepID=A0A7W5Z4W9_9HYPH|nr:sugar ABC transporter permease [Pseudochelatococcus contaminans]MBB3810263.1 multiple sugar transport system permease protein [Pseudochelatococcus contaminans]
MQRGSTATSAYLFIAPALFILVLTLLLPAVLTIGMSFTNVTFLRPTRLVGLQNYITLFNDYRFHQAVWNTIVYTVGVTIPTMFLGLLAAVAVNRRFTGRVAVRTIFYLPALTSLIACATVWLYLYEPHAGPLNGLLSTLGLPRQLWLQNPNIALGALMVVSIWRDFGTAMVIYLAGLQDIPEYVYEAARIDDAGSLTIFFRITIPLLSSVTFYLLIILIVQSFQVFGLIYAMTGGGPLNATSTIVFQMYQTAFGFTRFGYASAMSTVLFFTILLFSLIGAWVARKLRV